MSDRQRSAAVAAYVVGWIILAFIGCIVLVVKTVPPHWALWSMMFIPIAAVAIFFAMLAGRCSAYIEHPPRRARGGLYIGPNDPRALPSYTVLPPALLTHDSTQTSTAINRKEQ